MTERTAGRATGRRQPADLPVRVRTALDRLNRLGRGEVGDPLRRLPWHWPVLAFWAAFWCNIMVSRTRAGRGWTPSWPFAAAGARLLFQVPFAHGGGLALFGDHPDLQSGPLTFILAEPVTLLGGRNGLYPAQVLMTALGLVALLALERAAFAHRPDAAPSRIRWTVLGGGLAVLPVWAYAGVFWGHFDDVLALLFTSLALWAVAARKPLLVGLCLALAIDSKPWAAGFSALLLAVPGGGWSWRSPRLRALGLVAVVIGALWLPFVVADSQTLHSLSAFTIQNTPDSALRALGVTDPGTPSWDRSTQILVGCLLGGLALWRRRWPAVLLLGVCARLILEPGDYPYYYLGLLLGALVWDLLGSRRPSPIGTVAVAAVFFAFVPLAGMPALQGQCKLVAMVAIVLALLLIPAARGASGTVVAQSTGEAETGGLAFAGLAPGHGGSEATDSTVVEMNRVVPSRSLLGQPGFALGEPVWRELAQRD